MRQSGDLIYKVTALTGDMPEELFKQAFKESNGREDVKDLFEVVESQGNSEETSGKSVLQESITPQA